MGLLSDIGIGLGSVQDQNEQRRAIEQQRLLSLITANPTLIQQPGVADSANRAFRGDRSILDLLENLPGAQNQALDDAFLRNLTQQDEVGRRERQSALRSAIAQAEDFPGKGELVDAIGSGELSNEDLDDLEAGIAEGMRGAAEADAAEQREAKISDELFVFEEKEKIKAENDTDNNPLNQALKAITAQTNAMGKVVSSVFDKPDPTPAARESAEQQVALQVQEATDNFVNEAVPFVILQRNLRKKVFGGKDASVEELMREVQSGEHREAFEQALLQAQSGFNLGSDEGRAAAFQLIDTHPELGPSLKQRRLDIRDEMIQQATERDLEVVNPQKQAFFQGRRVHREEDGTLVFDVQDGLTDESRKAFGEQVEPDSALLPASEAQVLGGLPSPAITLEDMPLDIAGEISQFPAAHHDKLLALVMQNGHDYNATRRQLDEIKRLYAEALLSARGSQ